MVQTVMEKRGQEHLDRRADTEGLGVVKQGKKLEKSQFIDDEAEEDDGSGAPWLCTKGRQINRRSLRDQ